MNENKILDPSTKQYLDYLDKEMTIAGILSTFSVALAAGCVEFPATAQAGTYLAELFLSSKSFIWFGSGMMMLSAGLFYWQRALLAHDYGQISLSLSLGEHTGKTTEEWMKKADSWPTWIPHDCGIIFVVYASIEYALGIISHDFNFDKCCPIFLLLATAVMSVFTAISWTIYMLRRK